jgi:ethanolamine utilization protein EutN
MYLAKVIGTVVATRRYQDLEGIRFMVIQPVDKALKPKGGPKVAADSVDAGPGDLVYCVGSREASQAFEPHFIPVDDAIVGIVDIVTVEE